MVPKQKRCAPEKLKGSGDRQIESRNGVIADQRQI